MAVTLAASRRRPGPGLASGFPASRRREITVAYLLLAPAVLMVFGVLAYPLGWSLWLSLTNFTVQEPSKAFVGLANYSAIVQDPAYWRGAANTMGYFVATTVLKLGLGVGVALLLARPFPGRAFVFILAFLPWAYPGGLGLVGWYWFIIPPLHTAYSLAMSNLRFAFDAWF